MTFELIIKLLRESLLFLGASFIWLIQLLGSPRLSFRKYVWEREIQYPEWIQLLAGAIFIALIIVSVVLLV